MKNRTGKGLVCTALVIGIAIGFCGGFTVGSHMGNTSDKESQETEAAENVQNPLAYDSEIVLTIGDVPIDLDEINARTYMARDQYVALYGEEPWLNEMDNGMTVAEYAKVTMLEEIQRQTILCVEASKDATLALSDAEITECQQQADTYMQVLGDTIAEQFGVKREALIKINEKEMLSIKAYNKILQNIADKLLEDDNYQSMSSEEREKEQMDQFNTYYNELKDNMPTITTETWDAIVIGAAG